MNNVSQKDNTMSIAAFKHMMDQAREANPDLSIIATQQGNWVEVESYDINGLRWRHRSFEANFEDTFRRAYGI